MWATLFFSAIGTEVAYRSLYTVSTFKMEVSMETTTWMQAAVGFGLMLTVFAIGLIRAKRAAR